MEDVYTIGKTDYSSGWWGAFSKYYVVPAGQVWYAQFNLNINPEAPAVYKNFALVFTNDNYEVRNGDGYAEYGVIRFDNDPTKNSEWGSHIDRSLISGTFTNSTDADEIDPSVQKFNGKITLTVDRKDGGLFIEMRNGDLIKTYTQKTSFPDGATSEGDICCRIGVEGSFVQFLTTNIEPIGGCTSKDDKQPVSMVLNNVPSEIQQGIELAEAMKGVTATVTYEQDVVKEVTADQLIFNSIPDLANPGMKTLVAMYNKTTNGEIAVKPIMASAEFKVVPSADKMTSLTLKSAPKRTTYYFYNSDAVSNVKDRTLLFDREGLEVIATYEGGYTDSYNLDSLEISDVKAQAGSQTITLTAKSGKYVTVDVNVKESALKLHRMAESSLGTEDCTAGWWSVFTQDVNVPAGETYQVDFTNYSSLANNWNNFVVILRKANLAEYAVLRADYYGWGAGYEGNPSLLVGGYPENWEGWNWDEWRVAMNGAKVSLYITNCNNGTADVQAVIKGSDGNTYKLYYLSIGAVEPSDLNFSFTCDGSYLVF